MRLGIRMEINDDNIGHIMFECPACGGFEFKYNKIVQCMDCKNELDLSLLRVTKGENVHQLLRNSLELGKIINDMKINQELAEFKYNELMKDDPKKELKDLLESIELLYKSASEKEELRLCCELLKQKHDVLRELDKIG